MKKLKKQFGAMIKMECILSNICKYKKDKQCKDGTFENCSSFNIWNKLSIKIGIVGSRNFSFNKLNERQVLIHTILEALQKTRNPFYKIVVISGGAKGIDTLAELEAYKLGIKFIPFNPDYSRYDLVGNDIYYERNKLIAKFSDWLIAFPKICLVEL